MLYFGSDLASRQVAIVRVIAPVGRNLFANGGCPDSHRMEIFQPVLFKLDAELLRKIPLISGFSG